VRCLLSRFGTAVAVLTAATLWVARSVEAQAVSFWATTEAQWVRNALILRGAREEIAGPWFGAAAELRLGAVVLGGSGSRGKLRPASGGFPFERTAGEVQALLRFEPVRWVGLEGSYTVRAYSSAAGYQRWDISAVGVVLSTSLGHPALRTYAKAFALPSVYMGGDTSGVVVSTKGQSPNVRFASEAGLQVAPTGLPLLFAVHYRFERYDFSGQPWSRFEQNDALAVSVGFRAGR